MQKRGSMKRLSETERAILAEAKRIRARLHEQEISWDGWTKTPEGWATLAEEGFVDDPETVELHITHEEVLDAMKGVWDNATYLPFSDVEIDMSSLIFEDVEMVDPPGSVGDVSLFRIISPSVDVYYMGDEDFVSFHELHVAAEVRPHSA